jgi:SAM-dependent methyltransferase
MTLADGKTEYIARILAREGFPEGGRVLVVGCGEGLEAAILAHRLRAQVTGIDFPTFDGRPNLLPRYAEVPGVDLLEGDANRLAFDDASFDLVYSFHALEHMPDPPAAAAEMRRVLRPGGRYYVGAPNRSRLFAYFGAKKGKLTLAQKVGRNLHDWGARLRGRFRNDLGEHAGFTRRELADLCREAFGHAQDATVDYYLTRYPRHRALIGILTRTRLDRLLLPSVYVLGKAR